MGWICEKHDTGSVGPQQCWMCLQKEIRRLQEIIEKQRQDKAEVVESKWQPIKTAPKDGTPVLVYNGRQYLAVGGGGFWYIHTTLSMLGVEPTHWQPLPEPPTTEAERIRLVTKDQSNAN